MDGILRSFFAAEVSNSKTWKHQRMFEFSDGKKKLRTCNHQMRKVVGRKLGKFSEVGAWFLKLLVDRHCPVTWSIGASTVVHFFSFETWVSKISSGRGTKH